METDIPNKSYAQKANEVSAMMAQVVKQPPAFVDFLRVQGAAIKRVMNAVGLAYFIQDEQGLSCLLADNISTLRLEEHSAQREAFLRAIKQVAATQESLVLQANDIPIEVLHGQSANDAPSPHQLPFFNETPYWQFFVPLALGNGAFGVLHAWFERSGVSKPEELLKALQQISSETELHFQSTRASQLAGEIGRIYSYSRFLEALGGLADANSIQQKIVDYARDASNADRVSLLVADDYRKLPAETQKKTFERYIFQCASGIQVPHDKSEEARVLERTACFLLNKIQETSEVTPFTSNMPPPEGIKSQEAPPAAPVLPPKVRLEWILREEQDSSALSLEQQAYLSIAPMNWATVLPLYDLAGQVCGLLLLEGKSNRDHVASSLLSMAAFSCSAGGALGQALFWSNRWSLRCAHQWIDWKDRFLDTRKKRHWARWLTPVFILLIILLFPCKFYIKGISQVRPAQVLQLPSQNLARIVSVFVHEGESVQEGELLVQLDTYELELELQRYQGEYLRALTDSDRLLEEGDEAGMQAARLQSQKALAHMDRIRYQLDHSSIRAPFDGLILGPKGLGQRVGQVVQVGEPIIEIASPEKWEVRVHLTEQDLVFLEKFLESRGQVLGQLRLTSDPSERYPLKLTSREELSYGLNVQGDAYYFDAVLPLDVNPSLRRLLKAGFEGRVAFYVGWRPLVYTLFRGVFLSIKVNWF